MEQNQKDIAHSLGEETNRQSWSLFLEFCCILSFKQSVKIWIGPEKGLHHYFFPEKTCVHRTNTYQYNLGRKLKGKFKIDKVGKKPG